MLSEFNNLHTQLKIFSMFELERIQQAAQIQPQRTSHYTQLLINMQKFWEAGSFNKKLRQPFTDIEVELWNHAYRVTKELISHILTQSKNVFDEETITKIGYISRIAETTSYFIASPLDPNVKSRMDEAVGKLIFLKESLPRNTLMKLVAACTMLTLSIAVLSTIAASAALQHHRQLRNQLVSV
jgi:hypothetical protein